MLLLGTAREAGIVLRRPQPLFIVSTARLRVVGNARRRAWADPFIVSAARLRAAATLIVVADLNYPAATIEAISRHVVAAMSLTRSLIYRQGCTCQRVM